MKKIWIEVFLSLAILSILLGVLVTAISFGSIADIPVASGLIFSAFLFCGLVFEIMLRLGGKMKEKARLT